MRNGREEKHCDAHHISAGSLPNWAGTDFVRQYEISGNHLTLKTSPQLMDGKAVTIYLIWEKLEALG